MLVINIRTTNNTPLVIQFKITAYNLYIFPPEIMTLMPLEKKNGFENRKKNLER
jgi:hypothetical protein